MAPSLPTSLPELPQQPQQQQQQRSYRRHNPQHQETHPQRRWQAVGRGRFRRLHAAEAALKECEWEAVFVHPAGRQAPSCRLVHRGTICVDCEDAVQALHQIIDSTCCCDECSSSGSRSCCSSSNNGSVWASPFNSPSVTPDVPCHNVCAAAGPSLPAPSSSVTSAAAAAAAAAAREEDCEGGDFCSSPLRLMRRNLARLVSDGVPAQLLLVRFGQKAPQQKVLPHTSGDGPAEAPEEAPGREDLLVGMSAAQCRLTGSSANCSSCSNSLLLVRARRSPADERQPVAVLPLDGSAGAATERCSSCLSGCREGCPLAGAGGLSKEADGHSNGRRSCSSCSCARWCNLSSCGSVLGLLDCGNQCSELVCCLLVLPIVEYRMRCSTGPEEWEFAAAAGSSNSSSTSSSPGERRNSSGAVCGLSPAAPCAAGDAVAALCEARVAPSLKVFLGSVVCALHEYFYRAALRIDAAKTNSVPPTPQSHLAPAAALAEAMLARGCRGGIVPCGGGETQGADHQCRAAATRGEEDGPLQQEACAAAAASNLREQQQQLHHELQEEQQETASLRGSGPAGEGQQREQQWQRWRPQAELREQGFEGNGSPFNNCRSSNGPDPPSAGEVADLARFGAATDSQGPLCSATPGFPKLLRQPVSRAGAASAARIRRASTGELALRRKRLQQQRRERSALYMMVLQQLPNGPPLPPPQQQPMREQKQQQGQGEQEAQQRAQQQAEAEEARPQPTRYGDTQEHFWQQPPPHLDPSLQHAFWRQQQVWQQQMWQQRAWPYAQWQQQQELLSRHQWQQQQQHEHRPRVAAASGSPALPHEAGQRAAAAAAAHRQMQHHFYMQQLHQYHQQQLRMAGRLHGAPDDSGRVGYLPFLPLWMPQLQQQQQHMYTASGPSDLQHQHMNRNGSPLIPDSRRRGPRRRLSPPDETHSRSPVVAASAAREAPPGSAAASVVRAKATSSYSGPPGLPPAALAAKPGAPSAAQAAEEAALRQQQPLEGRGRGVGVDRRGESSLPRTEKSPLSEDGRSSLASEGPSCQGWDRSWQQKEQGQQQQPQKQSLKPRQQHRQQHLQPRDFPMEKRADGDICQQEQQVGALDKQHEADAPAAFNDARYGGYRPQDKAGEHPPQGGSDRFAGFAEGRRRREQQRQQHWYADPYQQQQLPHMVGPHQMYHPFLHPHVLLHMQQQAAAAAAVADPQNLGYIPSVVSPSARGWLPITQSVGMLMYQQHLLQLQQQYAAAAADQQGVQSSLTADERQGSQQQQQDMRLYGHPQQNRWHWGSPPQAQQWAPHPYMYVIPGLGVPVHPVGHYVHPRDQQKQPPRSEDARNLLHATTPVGAKGLRGSGGGPGEASAAGTPVVGAVSPLVATDPALSGCPRGERGRQQRHNEGDADAGGRGAFHQLQQQMYEQQLAAAGVLRPWSAPLMCPAQQRSNKRESDRFGPGVFERRSQHRFGEPVDRHPASNTPTGPYACPSRLQPPSQQGGCVPHNYRGGSRAASDSGDMAFHSLPFTPYAARPYLGGSPWTAYREWQLPLDEHSGAEAEGSTREHPCAQRQRLQRPEPQQLHSHRRLDQPFEAPSNSRSSSGENQSPSQQTGNRHSQASRGCSSDDARSRRAGEVSPDQRPSRLAAVGGTPSRSSTDGDGGGGLLSSVCFEQHANHCQFPGSPAAGSVNAAELSQAAAPAETSAPATLPMPTAANSRASAREHSGSADREPVRSESPLAGNRSSSCPAAAAVADGASAAAGAAAPGSSGEPRSARMCLEGNSVALGSLEDGGACLRGLSRGEFNLRSFLVATTPAVRLPKKPERLRGAASSDGGLADELDGATGACKPTDDQAGREPSCEREAGLPNFLLSDLWRSFDDASIFGLEVPLLDEEQRPTYVVYVPYLSALHLFPQAKASAEDDNSSKREAAGNSSSGCFRFMEVRLPYQRRPLYQQVSQLLQGAEVTQSQQLQLLVCSSEELSDDSWLCIYWQAIQREFCKIPAPSFLVYYRLRFTASPQTPTAADESAPREAVDPKVEEGRDPSEGGSDRERGTDPTEEGERFIALVRFAVIASKGHQEWLSSGNDDRSHFFRVEMRRLEEWLQKLQVNHPDFNTFKMGANRR